MAVRSIHIQKTKGQYQINGSFSTFIWKDRESDCYIAFVPELDLVAYDVTKSKVLKNLDVVMDEFFRYTIQKGTLDAELAKLGWKGTEDAFEAPSMESVASRNQQFSAVLNNEEFTRQNHRLAIAI